MRDVLCLLLCVAILPWSLSAQTRAGAPVETAVYAVAYVEVMPSSRAAAVTAFRRYREASRTDEGYARLELLEQIGRSGHFVILETWTDQKASDAHGMAAHTKQFPSTLEAIRSSEYDQRPYKTLSVGSAPAAADGQAIYVVTHVDTIPTPQSGAAGLLKRLAGSSRNDQGNARFDVLQHAMRANHFTIVETWQNQKALDAHATAAHTRQYRDELKPMAGSPLDERLYKPIE